MFTLEFTIHGNPDRGQGDWSEDHSISAGPRILQERVCGLHPRRGRDPQASGAEGLMSVARNKMMLGALTMGDLHALVRETGILWRDRYREFSLGRNWLPVGEVRKQGSALGLWMEDIGEMPDVSIPLDSVVKVQGDTVTLVLDSDCVNLYTSRDTVELRIRLDFEPFQRSEK